MAYIFFLSCYTVLSLDLIPNFSLFTSRHLHILKLCLHTFFFLLRRVEFLVIFSFSLSRHSERFHILICSIFNWRKRPHSLMMKNFTNFRPYSFFFCLSDHHSVYYLPAVVGAIEKTNAMLYYLWRPWQNAWYERIVEIKDEAKIASPLPSTWKFYWRQTEKNALQLIIQ